jgi:hypothetical protein
MIELGDTVYDSITSFRGVAVGRREYIYELVPEILVQPVKLDESGSPVEAIWIPEARLKKGGE